MTHFDSFPSPPHLHDIMKKQKRVGSCPDSEVYPSFHKNIGHLSITGGYHLQDNRRYASSHHNNSKTYNIRDESTIFNDQVSGYIRSAKTQGPITAYMQETNVVHKGQSLGPDVPRGLGTSQVSMPSPSK